MHGRSIDTDHRSGCSTPSTSDARRRDGSESHLHRSSARFAPGYAAVLGLDVSHDSAVGGRRSYTSLSGGADDNSTRSKAAGARPPSFGSPAEDPPLVSAEHSRGSRGTQQHGFHDTVEGLLGAVQPDSHTTRPNSGRWDAPDQGHRCAVDVEASVPHRLAARLGALEAKLAACDGGESDSPLFCGMPNRQVDEVHGRGRQLLSAAESDVRSAALRHALLLEDRGLRLERAEEVLRRKAEEEMVLRKEIQRLTPTIAAEAEARRQLAEAEREIEALTKRCEALEELAGSRADGLEGERHARSKDQQLHAAEMERLKAESSEVADALSREAAAAASSRETCEQMGAICRQMRQAAEETAVRATDAEERARRLEAELASAKGEALESERNTISLRAAVEEASRQMEDQKDKGKADREAVLTLRGLLQDRDHRLELAEKRVSATERRRDDAVEDCARKGKLAEELGVKLQQSHDDAEQLRSRLVKAGDLAAVEAGRAQAALEAERVIRSKLDAACVQETALEAENASLVAKVDELNVLLAKLSTDLSASSKLAHDRSAEANDSARAAEEAELRLNHQKRLLDEETRRNAEATKEAEHRAGAAKMATDQAEAARLEAQRALARSQSTVASALERLEESLADALEGMGDFAKRALPRRPVVSRASGADAIFERAYPHDSRADERHDARLHAARGGDGSLASVSSAVSPGGSGSAVEAAAMTSRIERILTRIMRRVHSARDFRSWVSNEVQKVRGGAHDGLKELQASWQGCLDRLQKAEGKLVRLREQATYGGRRAALEAREACYAKLERVEKEKWSIKGYLVSEERKVEALRTDLERERADADAAAASAQHQQQNMRDELEQQKRQQQRLQEKAHLEYRTTCDELQWERSQRKRLQDKAKRLEEQASMLEEKLSALSQQISMYKVSETEQVRERERLLQAQKRLQSRVEQEERVSEEARKTVQDRDHVFALERAKDRAERIEEEKRLNMLLEDAKASGEEQALRMSALLDEERSARDLEASRLSAMLEEERKARQAESALGEAVLREVRETQSLLGEMSPCSARSAGADARRSFRGELRPGMSREARGSRRAVSYHSSSLSKQTDALERIVAEAKSLTKLTSSFYDQYAETYRESMATIPTSKEGRPRVGTDAPADLSTSVDDRRRNPLRTTSSRRARSDPCLREISSRTRPGQVVNTGVGGFFGTWRGSGRGACEEVGSHSTAERGACQTAVAGAGGRGVEREVLLELDRRCYALLESNARLCQQLQGVGMKYAGLAREVQESSCRKQPESTSDDEFLDVGDLLTGNISSDDDGLGRRDSGAQGERCNHRGGDHHTDERGSDSAVGLIADRRWAHGGESCRAGPRSRRKFVCPNREATDKLRRAYGSPQRQTHAYM